MLLEIMSRQAQAIERQSLLGLEDAGQWPAWSRKRRLQWLDMLGIDDAFLQCELDARITSRHEVEGVRLENLHFQALPGQRIACNLWLPPEPPPESSPESSPKRFPGVIYLCGHGMPGKVCYQNHGRWFAQQGYACLVMDAIQIGESEGMHHGLFFHHQSHWISQGYTPAGVEVQAARRALDYLATRREIDAARCGLTGISGGATMSLFAAAADERFAAVAPHCIAGTLEQLIGERSLDTHCDCTTWVNRHRLGLTAVAALIAPRPLLLSFSTLDALCRPEPMRDLAHQLRQVWTMLGKPHAIATSEDDIPHAYSALICKRILSWFNVHLRGLSPEVADEDVLPFVGRHAEDYSRNVSPAMLCAYESDDPPHQQRMAGVDRSFIRLPGRPPLPRDANDWEARRQTRLEKLRATAFDGIPRPADCVAQSQLAISGERYRLISFEAEEGLRLDMAVASPSQVMTTPAHFLAGPCDPQASRTRPAGAMGTALLDKEAGLATVHVRGTAATSIGPSFEWFARRAYPLLGQTLPQLQCFDLLRAVHILRKDAQVADVALYGKGEMSSQAIYAALLCDGVTELVLESPATTHWRSGPEYPGILRAGDLPANLALFFPRPITFVSAIPLEYDWVCRLYETLGRQDAIRVIPAASMWTPWAGRK